MTREHERAFYHRVSDAFGRKSTHAEYGRTCKSYRNHRRAVQRSIAQVVSCVSARIEMYLTISLGSFFGYREQWQCGHCCPARAIVQRCRICDL